MSALIHVFAYFLFTYSHAHFFPVICCNSLDAFHFIKTERWKKWEANERLNRKWIASKRINVFNEALECCCCYCCCSHWKASPKMEYFYREISFLYFSISEWMEMNMKINCRYARHRRRTSMMKMMKMMMMQTTWILNMLWCFCIDHFQFTTVE